MNTQKIREALEAAAKDSNTHTSTELLCYAALDELDEAEAGRKVLTDEEILRYSAQYTYACEKEIQRALIWVRDNGYLAPAPSEPVLTVEQAYEVAGEWCLEWCGHGGPDSNDWNDLRARLTAAANTINP